MSWECYCVGDGEASFIFVHERRQVRQIALTSQPLSFFCTIYFFGGLEFVGHSFAYVAHFIFMRDFCIRTQRSEVASRRAIPT
jgi:hypothetical protein